MGRSWGISQVQVLPTSVIHSQVEPPERNVAQLCPSSHSLAGKVIEATERNTGVLTTTPLLSGCHLVNSDFNAIRTGQVYPNRSPVSPTLRVLAPCQGQKTNSWMETSTPDGAIKKLVEVDPHRLSMLHPSEQKKYLHPHGT